MSVIKTSPLYKDGLKCFRVAPFSIMYLKKLEKAVFKVYRLTEFSNLVGFADLPGANAIALFTFVIYECS